MSEIQYGIDMRTYTVRVWWTCDRCGTTGSRSIRDVDADLRVCELDDWHTCRGAA